MSSSEFQLTVADAKLKDPKQRTPFERALASCKQEFQAVHNEHIENELRKKTAGILLANEAPIYPDDFIPNALSKIEGQLWAASTRDMISVTL